MLHSTLRKKLSIAAPVAVLIGLATGNAAQASTFQTGDVFAAVSNGQVQHYDSTPTLLETLNTTQGGFTTGMAFDQAGNLYVTNFSAGSVSKFDNNGNLLGIWGNATGLATPESIVFNQAGDAYVGTLGGGIVKFDQNGNVLQNLSGAGRVDWLDLAADQKTIFYTQEGRQILRYDVSTDTQLSDFAALPGAGEAFALRLLSDGGLLVADGDNVKRLDSTGAVVQTYDVAGEDNWFALNLDPDGKSFWSGDFGTANFYKFDIATGNQLTSKNTGTGGNTLFGLAVFGEITQGGGGGGKTVPEPSSVLGVLALGVFGAGSILKRQKNS
jgi:sugar lactone lactonase YvrE